MTTLAELPIFDQIMSDGEVPPRQLQLWRTLAKHLDVVRARKIPMDLIERALGVDQSTIRKLVLGLIERGYLLRENGLYRIPLSREMSVDVTRARDESPSDRGAQPVVVPRRARRAPINSDDVV